jgi:hypothetical protein
VEEDKVRLALNGEMNNRGTVKVPILMRRLKRSVTRAWNYSMSRYSHQPSDVLHLSLLAFPPDQRRVLRASGVRPKAPVSA